MNISEVISFLKLGDMVRVKERFLVDSGDEEVSSLYFVVGRDKVKIKEEERDILLLNHNFFSLNGKEHNNAANYANRRIDIADFSADESKSIEYIGRQE